VRPEARLVLTSATVLFAELLLIRWVPAQVVYVGFFANFVLIASFLGLALGLLLGRRFGDRPPWLGAIPLAALVSLVYLNQVNSFVATGGTELFLGFNEARHVDIDFVVLGLTITLTSAAIACFALPLGRLLTAMPPLRAYAFDIAGSIAGVALFSLLSWLQTPPLVWFSALGALLLPQTLTRRPPRAALLGAAAMAVVIGLTFIDQLRADQYSPYYRISLYTPPGWAQAIAVNGIPHQVMWPVASERNPHMEPYFDQIYSWLPGRKFQHVLIVGAGTGTDTAVALQNDVGAIDAVEIDPRIEAIGAAQHPDRPYADGRVRVTIDDGRAFLRRSDERYDLIIFAQTDSLTLVATTANLRLESFLFTREAFAAAHEHLTADGVFVLYNFYRESWLVDRYARMMADAFGTQPIVRSYPETGLANASVLAVGAPVAALPVPAGASRPTAAQLAAAPQAASDEWPFSYLRQPSISVQYLVTLGALLIFALVAVLAAGRLGGIALGGFSPHFFALGASFLLLETRSLVTFSLLFGTTWYVNALVIAGILVSVLLAIFVQMRTRRLRRDALAAALFATLALAYFVPPASLLIEPAWLRYALASAIAFAPIFFANLVFAASFRDTRAADIAFASNILGAMVGGVLEYAALLVGYQQLLVVIIALYVAALLLTRVRVLADRMLPA
jgi:SAM-dependent methyltransferase